MTQFHLRDPRTLTFPHDALAVYAMPDEAPASERVTVRSTSFELNWLPTIGPTTLALVRYLDYRLEKQHFLRISTYDLALQLGVGLKGGRHSPLWRSIERAARFNLLDRYDNRLVLRRSVETSP